MDELEFSGSNSDYIFALLGMIRDDVVREVGKRVSYKTKMKIVDIYYPSNMVGTSDNRVYRYANIEFDKLLVKLEFTGSNISDIVAYYHVEIDGKKYTDSTALCYSRKGINAAIYYIANSFSSAIISLQKESGLRKAIADDIATQAALDIIRGVTDETSSIFRGKQQFQ